jgi:integrase/recombinase XerD
MTIRLLYQESASRSPYRLVQAHDQEIDFANSFLDALHLRLYSPRSLRIYAYDLLHFTRWWLPQQPVSLAALTPQMQAAYVRHQLAEQPPPAPATINHRLTVLRCLYRFHTQQELSPQPIEHRYSTRSPLGYGTPHRGASRTLRVRQPERLILPLAPDQVARFWKSFHTLRDLSLVALMLYDGLRSREVLQLRLADLRLDEANVLVQGKGNKQRLLPLPPEVISAIQGYLQCERPLTSTAFLFVSLKGPHRGQTLTAAGLRSLFRYHRRRSGVPPAHPHRFRHTFGHDMVRAGISLPALMHLMGHTQIRTTMLYIRLSPREVWEEFAKAVQARAIAIPLPKNKP